MLIWPYCVGPLCYTYSMNSNKNPNLPAHAIACKDVTPGTLIVKDGYIVTVTKIVWYPNGRGIVTTDIGQRFYVNEAGTMRLAPDFVD